MTQKITKILITGGTGFIGEKVAQCLSKKYDVTVFVRGETSINNCKIFVGNLLNKRDVSRALKGVDCVIHMAARILGSEDRIFAFNVESTRTLVSASIKNKISKFIFLSSENVLWPGQSAYGKSKKKCEEIVKKSMNHLILRSSVVYGPNNKINLGRVIDRVKKNRIIFIPGRGNSLMQPIFVDDVAQYILNGLKYGVEGTFVLAGAEKTTLNSFIDTASKVLQVRRIKIHIPLFLIAPVIKIWGGIARNPPLKMSQLNNLNTDRIYDIQETCTALKYAPQMIDPCLRKTLVCPYEKS